MSLYKWFSLGFRNGFDAGQAVGSSRGESSSITLRGFAAAVFGGLLLRLIWRGGLSDASVQALTVGAGGIAALLFALRVSR